MSEPFDLIGGTSMIAERSIIVKKFLRNTFLTIFCIICFNFFEGSVTLITMDLPESWLYVAQYLVVVFSSFIIGREILVKNKTCFLSIVVVPVAVFVGIALFEIFVFHVPPLTLIVPLYFIFHSIVMHFYEDTPIIVALVVLQSLIYCLAMFFGVCKKTKKAKEEEQAEE